MTDEPKGQRKLAANIVTDMGATVVSHRMTKPMSSHCMDGVRTKTTDKSH